MQTKNLIEEMKDTEEYRMGIIHENARIFELMDKYLDHYRKLLEKFSEGEDAHNEKVWLDGVIQATFTLMRKI